MTLLLVVVSTAHAQTALVFDETPQILDLANNAQYLVDPAGTLNIQDIRSPVTESRWRDADGKPLNFGYSSAAYWVRLRFNYSGSDFIERLLEVGIPQIDEIRVFAFNGDIRTMSLSLGDRHNFAERPIPDRRFLAPLEFSPGETMDVYVRVQTSTSLQIPLKLWSRDLLYAQPSGYGLFYGIMLAMIVYNLLLFASLGDRSYLYLTLFAAVITLYHASIFGQGFRYLWPQSPWWNSVSPMVLGFLAVTLFASFTSSMLDLKNNNPRLRVLLIGTGSAAAVLAVASLFLAGTYTVRLQVLLTLIIVVLALAAGIYTWRLGVERAAQFTISWIVYLTGVIVLTLNKIGFLPVTWISSHAMEGGLIFQMLLLLSGAFSGSIRVLRNEYRAEHQFATHDELTGLPNRRLFKDRLDHALAKGRSRSLRVGLLFIDLDGFKSVNDTLGHVAGDLLLKGVSERLSAAVRRGDTVARIGGDEFTVILEDMTHNLDATLVARKIDTLFELPVALGTGVKLTIHPSIGIACFPDDGTTPEMLMSRADKEMYAAKNLRAKPQAAAI